VTGGLIRSNVRLKLFSLVLAYIAWAYVVSRSPGVRFINAPVEFQPPEGIVVADYNPREVRVRLQGDAPVLSKLSEQNVYARVQLEPGLRTNRPQRVAVQEREILGVPQGVGKEIITPALTVVLERKATKTVPVRVRLSGAPPAGWRVGEAVSDPPAVEVSGPEGSTRGVEQIWTEPVDVKNRKRGFTVPADLIRPDALVTLKPETVRLNLVIDEIARPLTLQVPVRPSDEAFTADPSVVKAVLEGPPSLLDRVRGNIVAVADTAAAPARGGGVTVRLEFPDLSLGEASRLRVVLLDPSHVRLVRR
jgi:hypothetical protein